MKLGCSRLDMTNVTAKVFDTLLIVGIHAALVIVSTSTLSHLDVHWRGAQRDILTLGRIEVGEFKRSDVEIASPTRDDQIFGLFGTAHPLSACLN